MSDVVVTVPKWFGLKTWIDEGDAAGTPWSGQLWDFSTWGPRPQIMPGERVYVVFNSRLRGYAPLVEFTFRERQNGQGNVVFVRGGEAVAVTIQEPVRGFRGWRERCWLRSSRPAPSPLAPADRSESKSD